MTVGVVWYQDVVAIYLPQSTTGSNPPKKLTFEIILIACYHLLIFPPHINTVIIARLVHHTMIKFMANKLGDRYSVNQFSHNLWLWLKGHNFTSPICFLAKEVQIILATKEIL